MNPRACRDVGILALPHILTHVTHLRAHGAPWHARGLVVPENAAILVAAIMAYTLGGQEGTGLGSGMAESAGGGGGGVINNSFPP